jgi:hypothetical protein
VECRIPGAACVLTMAKLKKIYIIIIIIAAA